MGVKVALGPNSGGIRGLGVAVCRSEAEIVSVCVCVHIPWECMLSLTAGWTDMELRQHHIH